MTWVFLAVLSALCLGIYDLLKKNAVRENAVLPVLFFGVVSGALVWLPFVIWSAIAPESVPHEFFQVGRMTSQEHLWLLAKSTLVSASWLFGYFALKHLPLSTAGPIRSTGPLWTILIATLFLGESPNAWQWAGVLTILASFYAFSLVGKLEGLHFHRDRWVWFMVAATLLGATSSIYDKFLLQNVGIPPSTVQAWFSIYLVAVLFPFYFWWRNATWRTGPFEWRWSIPLVGIALLVADIFYFTAVQDEKALISVISPVRRMSVIVTFFGGVLLFGEKTRVRLKSICLLILLVGVVLLNLRGAG